MVHRLFAHGGKPAFEAVGEHLIDTYGANLADMRRCVLDMHGLQIGRAADRLAGAAPRFLEQNIEHSPDRGGVESGALFAEDTLQVVQPFFLYVVGDLFGRCGSWRTGTPAVLEGIRLCETDIVHQSESGGKVPVGLAGKSNDKVRGKRNVRPRGANTVNKSAIVVRRITAVHGPQYFIRSGLDR